MATLSTSSTTSSSASMPLLNETTTTTTTASTSELSTGTTTTAGSTTTTTTTPSPESIILNNQPSTTLHKPIKLSSSTDSFKYLNEPSTSAAALKYYDEPTTSAAAAAAAAAAASTTSGENIINSATENTNDSSDSKTENVLNQLKKRNILLNSSSDDDEDEPKNNKSDKAFECNICLDTAKDAVVSLCGHLFCWPCLHQWLETRPLRQLCPVCKAAISADKVIPLYGRDSGKQEDPRKKTPPRPAGQRTEPEGGLGFQGLGFGDGTFHMSFGIGAFPFGFFASAFNMEGGRPANAAPRPPQDPQEERYLSKLFIYIAIMILTWLIFA